MLAIVHDLNLAARYADRLAVMHRGRIASWGPPAVLRDDLSSEVFSLALGVDRTPSSDLPLVLPRRWLTEREGPG